MSRFTSEELRKELSDTIKEAIKVNGHLLLTKDNKIKHRCRKCSFSCSRITRLQMHEKKHWDEMTPEERSIEEYRLIEIDKAYYEDKLNYLQGLKTANDVPTFNKNPAKE